MITGGESSPDASVLPTGSQDILLASVPHSCLVQMILHLSLEAPTTRHSLSYEVARQHIWKTLFWTMC